MKKGISYVVNNLYFYKKMKRNSNQITSEAIGTHVNSIITEGHNTKKAHQNTLQVIRKFFNGGEWLDEEYVNPDVNPNHLSKIDYIYNKLHEMYFHANSSDALIRLEPIIMNVALLLGFEQQGQLNTEKTNRLTLIVNYIKENYKKPGFPIQLNKLTLQNTTYESLNDLFGSIVDEIMAADSKSANSIKKGSPMNPNYEVIRVDDFETAHEIGNHSCSQSKLCYTQDENVWNNTYIKGINVAYAILSKGYLNISEVRGENTPYDEYGLSMIFLFIDQSGNIAYSNTRWNHSTNGQGPFDVDQSFTKSDISKLLNVNFDEVFKRDAIDYNNYEIVKKLGNGMSIVKTAKCEQYNFVNAKGQLLSDTWFYRVHEFKEGLAKVELYGQYNFITIEGRLISDIWFDFVYDFDRGLAKVRINWQYNFINTKGKFLSETWFDDAHDFYRGFAAVSINRKWNIIDGEGQFLSVTWFDYVCGFKEGFAKVLLNGKENFINTEGNLLSDMWFDCVFDFKEGLAKVGLNEQYNYINTNGRLISKIWFDHTYVSNEGFVKIMLNRHWYRLSRSGCIYD